MCYMPEEKNFQVFQWIQKAAKSGNIRRCLSVKGVGGKKKQ